jgi:hypothetical protein
MQERHSSGETYEKIAASFENERITRAHVWKMVNKGWEPDDPELRIILGLPAYKPMPVCPIHGVVHEYDCRSQVVKPLRQPSPPRPPRISIRKDDMGKAARSIKNNLSLAQVRELKELL